MNDMNLKRSKVDGRIRNVEQIPGESAAYNLAKKDAELFDDAKKYKLYSNQYIPLVKGINMVERIVAQGQYDRSCSGGSILHLNVENKITPEIVRDMVNFSSAKGVMYFAINYNHAQCKTCGKVYVGKYKKSPCHAADMRNYLRVVGFLTEVSGWAEARRTEYGERQFYGKVDFND
jgi:ribonucleoside-triphosphate reductase